MTRFIFVTGGVCSSLGKGVSAASIGCLLEKHGYKVSLQKFDPYVNVDPGTMSPHQHGEVYVTDDGAETDLDLGYYERFTNGPISRLNSVSTGQIYSEVIRKEREGKYLGQTVQVIPHITNEIKDRIIKVVKKDEPDFLICEIGGTVGDIESIPFLEAIRQFGQEHRDCLFIHVTLMTHIHASDELKSKPTQHSVRMLREIGIQPHMLICRSHKGFDKKLKEKTALFCNVPWTHVIDARDAENTIYEIPKLLRDQKVDQLVLNHFGITEFSPIRLDKWTKYVNKVRSPKRTVRVGMIGKYMELNDAYCSVHEAIHHAATDQSVKAEIVPVLSDGIELRPQDKIETIMGLDAIIIPGGFGGRGFEGMVEATRLARENNIPFLGICLGMQCAVVEIARHVVGIQDANSSEFGEGDFTPVVSYMNDQSEYVPKGGTMRLGLEECILDRDSVAYRNYRKDKIEERHRHRLEFNNNCFVCQIPDSEPIPADCETMTLMEKFEQNGVKISGMNPRKLLVEVIEIPDHKFFVGVQFHPEFKSKPLEPHPLFRGLVEAAIRE